MLTEQFRLGLFENPYVDASEAVNVIGSESNRAQGLEVQKQSIVLLQNQSQPGGGMNFTGLGIGNRHGVYVQLLGCCVSVAGMIFAFYVKPVLKRRREMESRSKIAPAEDVGRLSELSEESEAAVEMEAV